MSKLLWFSGGFLLALAALVLLAVGPLRRSGALALLDPVGQPIPPIAAPAAPAVGAAPTPQPALNVDSVLLWTRQSATSDTCGRLEIDSAHQAHYGACREGARLAQLTQSELDVLLYYVLRYRAFDVAASSAPGTVQEAAVALSLSGNGRLTASNENQAEVAQWAAQVYERLSEEERRGDLVARCRVDLTARLGLPIEDVRPVAIDAVRWPDACLGLREAGVFCAQVVTPGYRIKLLGNDGLHEYRADAYGRWRNADGLAAPFVLPAVGD